MPHVNQFVPSVGVVLPPLHPDAGTDNVGGELEFIAPPPGIPFGYTFVSDGAPIGGLATPIPIPATMNPDSTEFSTPVAGRLQYDGTEVRLFTIHGQAVFQWLLQNGFAPPGVIDSFALVLILNGSTVLSGTWLQPLGLDSFPQSGHAQRLTRLNPGDFIELGLTTSDVPGNVETINIFAFSLFASSYALALPPP